MTVPWFSSSGSGVDPATTGANESAKDGGASAINWKECAQVLYPQRRCATSSSSSSSSSSSRFSTLLLEHGEQHIQDWAVLAYSQPNHDSALDDTPSSRRRAGGGSASQSSTALGGSSIMNTATKSRSNKPKKKRKKVTKESCPTSHMVKLEGRLHLCSQSLVLEPQDASRPILRLPFVKCHKGPPQEYPRNETPIGPTSTGPFDPMCVQVDVTKYATMKANHAIGPIEHIPVPTTFRFTFLHSSPSTLVQLGRDLFRILLQNKNNKSHLSSSTTALDQLIQLQSGNTPNSNKDPSFSRPSLQDQPFDASNFKDARERPVHGHPLKCQWMQPLQSQSGCLVVTQDRLYFQPAGGILSDAGSSSAQAAASFWNINELVATARRYKGLEDASLELFWGSSSSRGRGKGTSPSLLLAMERHHERELLLRLLSSSSSSHTVPCHTDRDFVTHASHAWQAQKLSNFDYLLLLNSAAGRSMQDLSRYPVVPWVLQDYTSPTLDLTKESTFRDLTQPVGALNPDRLDYFQQRYEQMLDAVDHPFLYGTHYSAAAYVLYYLVRSMPEHQLCLQNGKFDAPDRLFHNLSFCFNCVKSNHADVKELIPEFYNPNMDYDFLINAKGLQLGATQNGDRVNDVVLPPWAKSPRDFLKKHRKALESELCTQMLPRWIDLIFGCKSRGEAAKDASNLFHHFAYMGPSDIANLPTQEERYQAELHATEFGLVPDQLFIGPHPLRHQTVDDSFIRADIGRNFTGGIEDLKADTAWELLEPPSHGSDNLLDDDESQVPDTPFLEEQQPQRDDVPDFFDNNPPATNAFQSSGQSPGRHPQSGESAGRRQRSNMPLSGTGDPADRSTSGTFSYLGGEPTLSNVSASSHPTVTLNPIEQSAPTNGNNGSSSTEWDVKFIEKTQIHDDAVSGCVLIPHGGTDNQSLLATTSLDGGLKVQTVSLSVSELDERQHTQGISGTLSRFSYMAMSRGNASSDSQSNKITEYRSHTSRDPLACLALASDGHNGKVAFAGGHDDVVLAYGINSGCAVASVYSHRDAVTGLDLSERPRTMSSTTLWPEKATHIMVSGSWDATIKVWSVVVANGETVSINREPLAELFDADSSIVTVSASSVPGTGGIVIAAGCADGSFCVWNVHADGVKVVIHKETARRGSGPCSVVKWSCERDQLTLFTGFATGKVASFKLQEGAMKKASAASVGVAVQCLAYSENILLIGCADGGLRLIPIRDQSYFTSDLSLWPSINNSSSPGISSVNIAFAGNHADGSGKCICSTGAADGSIAIFQLKKARSA